MVVVVVVVCQKKDRVPIDKPMPLHCRHPCSCRFSGFPNKIRLKRRSNLNFIVPTCRSIRPLPYPPVKNVPALVSYGMMVGKRHTNKRKAMDDDDSTLSAEDFAFLVNAANEPSISVPQQVVITSYKKASPENNEMEQQRTRHKLRTTKLHRPTIQRSTKSRKPQRQKGPPPQCNFKHYLKRMMIQHRRATNNLMMKTHYTTTIRLTRSRGKQQRQTKR